MVQLWLNDYKHLQTSILGYYIPKEGGDDEPFECLLQRKDLSIAKHTAQSHCIELDKKELNLGTKMD